MTVKEMGPATVTWWAFPLAGKTCAAPVFPVAGSQPGALRYTDTTMQSAAYAHANRNTAIVRAEAGFALIRQPSEGSAHTPILHRSSCSGTRIKGLR
jgi:hypothetical protein